MKLGWVCKVLLSSQSSAMPADAWVCPLVDEMLVLHWILGSVEWCKWALLERSSCWEFLYGVWNSSHTQAHHRGRKESDDPFWLTNISSHAQRGFRISEMLQMLSWGSKHADTKHTSQTQHVGQAAFQALAQPAPRILWYLVVLMCNAYFEPDVLGIPALKEFLWNFSHMVFFIDSVLNVLKPWVCKESWVSYTPPNLCL